MYLRIHPWKMSLIYFARCICMYSFVTEQTTRHIFIIAQIDSPTSLKTEVSRDSICWCNPFSFRVEKGIVWIRIFNCWNQYKLGIFISPVRPHNFPYGSNSSRSRDIWVSSIFEDHDRNVSKCIHYLNPGNFGVKYLHCHYHQKSFWQIM